MEAENKRKFIRLKAYHLVKYRLVSPDNKMSPSVLATIRDIGAGGVCLRIDERLPVSCLLELSINFPNISTSVVALAKVVWIKEINQIKRYEVGAQFVQIDDSVRLVIDKQVTRVHKRFKEKSA